VATWWTVLTKTAPAVNKRNGSIWTMHSTELGRQHRFWGPPRWQVSTETLLVATALYWTVVANQAFFGAVLQGRPLNLASSWGHAGAVVAMLTGAHLALLSLLSLLAPGRWVKALLALLLLATAATSYYMQAFGVVMDPSMMGNVLHTNPAEAGELLTWGLAKHLLLMAGLPLLLLWRVRIKPKPWRRVLWQRPGLLLAGVLLVVLALVSVFKSFGPLMRNQKELRYLVTPANLLWSGAAVAVRQAQGATKPRQPIGLDAQPGATMAARQQGQLRPLVVVLVVGETARAANWGLSGYARNTTPELSSWPLISFKHATSCGTNTDTSVPCLFAPVGRRDYDEDRIRGSESLLHLLARAGVVVHWRDNQSGCKGVCDGLPQDHVKDLKLPGLCEGAFCLDEGLLVGLGDKLAAASKTQGTQLWVLHMLGNHGPAYFRRYPKAFERFKPACQTDDLQRCSGAEITNAYDNALLYTDHVVAQLLKQLKAAQGLDTALVYVSDHGESLGEHNLYLHGLPYAIAPDVQKQVPFLMWLAQTPAQLGAGCLQTLAQTAPQRVVAHDHLFHTLLTLLDVKTALYQPAWDLLQPCRKP
jgi:lipid A ethanolaminephosphotransferase